MSETHSETHNPARPLPRFDASGYVRRSRRLGDLSQRDLGDLVGMPQSTIARDVHAVPEHPTMKMLFRGAEPVPRSGVWHHHRQERDRLRAEASRSAQHEQLTVGAAIARRRGHPKPER
ncbi:hypothetical protein [Microbacterium sp.]|uniref:hypothetical protein n=1 Tax=Microbacterium sp. TaxID=51671 RepID=UPI003C786AD4